MPPSSHKKNVQVGTQLPLRIIVNSFSDGYMWFSYESRDRTAWRLECDLYILREHSGY